ncbi:peptidyl-prolyl cis-trans isomerase FKBP16-3, chloroplastic isoform X2 [Syzygium oleosum]|uniref:peptidyl-prolyl cis-trans isomerase FKBP16-3, chloroplastic isoform X2 n=1 Tax=Syzygium oleosum TaxID=219896 RepID=UPI0024B9F210|nr:peptidyl-prolyl cis-trans isomerase FKBP16-3, chloroplastic isoform X2 [Syzygium oleosum]
MDVTLSRFLSTREGMMAASSVSSLFLPSPAPGLDSGKTSCTSFQSNAGRRLGGPFVRCSGAVPKVSNVVKRGGHLTSVKRRDAIGLLCGLSSFFINSFDVNGAGLPPEEKPKLCDSTCEKELENVAANYVAMVPSGQIFDSSLEKGQLYIFRVGSGQVIKGLDEGLLSMKVGGKRRLYIPGSLAFPKGLTSAPGRPRVAPNSPVIFDVSLEYIPGLEVDEE